MRRNAMKFLEKLPADSVARTLTPRHASLFLGTRHHCHFLLLPPKLPKGFEKHLVLGTFFYWHLPCTCRFLLRFTQHSIRTPFFTPSVNLAEKCSNKNPRKNAVRTNFFACFYFLYWNVQSLNLLRLWFSKALVRKTNVLLLAHHKPTFLATACAKTSQTALLYFNTILTWVQFNLFTVRRRL